MATHLEQCMIGSHLSDPCHKYSFSKTAGIINLSELTLHEKDLLFLRCDFKETTTTGAMTVCLHHQAMFLKRYEYLQKNCCDPYSKHSKPSKGRSVLDIASAAKLTTRTGKNIKPGQKLCPRCMCAFSAESECTGITNSTTEEEEDIDDMECEAYEEPINTSITALGCSPLKLKKVSTRDVIGYSARKLHDAELAMKYKMARRLNVKDDTFTTQKSSDECQKCKDLDDIITSMKTKCSTSTRDKQIQLLTLVPQTWSIEKTSQEFGIPYYRVRKARDLRKSEGVLAEPAGKRGKTIAEDVKEKVTDFYQDDEYSRICPGKKDVVSVKRGSERVHERKRLLLANLHELYSLFKEKTEGQYKIGFSKFCELRPKWCITVGCKGTHSVCVCEMHQNAKLLLCGVGALKLDYKTLMSIIVCDIESRDCMVHRCEYCPGKDALCTHIQTLIAEQLELDEDDMITFSQWTHTDRTTIIPRQESVTDYIALLCDQLDKLTTHHYIAKAQAAYLTKTKESLSDDTVVILMDFSENYSFTVQDSIQGFYWENRQATLHPFAVYYHDDDSQLQKIAICVISDCMQHDTTAVYAFIHILIQYLKTKIPAIKHVKYFSDGCAGQYKNYKNFSNLCMHQHDFGLTAEWHFFATSHGKSACDGIGGTVKHLASRYSLQHPSGGHILTPGQLHDWAVANIKGILFFYVSTDDIEHHKEMLAERFDTARTVPGTRSHHCFKPTSSTSMEISRVSVDEVATTVTINATPAIMVHHYQAGQYVAVVHNQHWYLSNVVDVSQEHQDLTVIILQPKGPARSFKWPQRPIEMLIPVNHVLCPVPEVVTETGRMYKVETRATKRIEECFARFRDQHFT